MTSPLTSDAWTEARELVRQSLKAGGPGLTEATREAVVGSIMLKLTNKVLAPLLAAHQQVTAERDEARERGDRINDKLGELIAAVREDLPLAETLIAERQAAEASLATATAELARLRAEGEAKDRAILLLLPFVDYAAGEGLAFVETEDGEHPEMDAADIMAAAAEALGLELGSDAYLALLPAGYDAIRAARANPNAGA